MTRQLAPEARGGHSLAKVSFRVLILTIAVLLAAPSPAFPAELIRLDEATRPDFVLQDLNGNAVSLRDFAGRTVLVHFFATWCEPCREELPALNRLGVRATSAVVLAISVAENGQRVNRFFQQMPVQFPVLLDLDRAVAKSWDITTLPTTYVLDAALRPRRMVEADYPWDTLDVALDGELTIHAPEKIKPISE